ncbi:MAG: hypothetical protein ABIA04_03450 [Pseudomonadota bacterium]
MKRNFALIISGLILASLFVISCGLPTARLDLNADEENTLEAGQASVTIPAGAISGLAEGSGLNVSLKELDEGAFLGEFEDSGITFDFGSDAASEAGVASSIGVKGSAELTLGEYAEDAEELSLDEDMEIAWAAAIPTDASFAIPSYLKSDTVSVTIYYYNTCYRWTPSATGGSITETWTLSSTAFDYDSTLGMMSTSFGSGLSFLPGTRFYCATFVYITIVITGDSAVSGGTGS